MSCCKYEHTQPWLSMVVMIMFIDYHFCCICTFDFTGLWIRKCYNFWDAASGVWSENALWWSNAIEQSPFWEANIFSISQEISSVLWNMKVQCRVHERLSFVPILSKTNLFHSDQPHFYKIHFIILSSTHTSFLSFKLFNPNCVCIAHLCMCATCPRILLFFSSSS
jgi:hypothetical protein